MTTTACRQNLWQAITCFGKCFIVLTAVLTALKQAALFSPPALCVTAEPRAQTPSQASTALCDVDPSYPRIP